MTLDETAMLLAYMAATWPRLEVGEQTLMVYHEHFQRYPVARMKNCLKWIAENSEHPFPPSISEIHKTLKLKSSPERKTLKGLPEPEHDRKAIVASQQAKLDAILGRVKSVDGSKDPEAVKEKLKKQAEELRA